MATPRRNVGSSSSETWWVVLAFAPFLNWLSFLYIGLRSGNSNWKVWTAVYAAPSVLWILLPELEDILLWVWFGLWFVSIYHAFRVRADYNRRMDARRGVIAQPAAVPSWQPPVPTPVQALDPIDAVIPSQPPTRVDVNNAPEEVIAAMPGVGAILAQKAVAERQKRGGFSSVEDFGQALGLQPHIVERIRPMVVISSQPAQVEPETNQGRVVDV